MKSGSARIRLEWKPQKNLSFGLMSSFDRSVQGGYPYAVCDSVTHKPGEVDYNDYSFYKRTLSTTGFSADYQGTGYSINSRPPSNISRTIKASTRISLPEASISRVRI